MIISIEAKLPDGRHFAIARNGNTETYTVIAKNNLGGIIITDIGLSIILNTDMSIEDRQAQIVNWANSVGL